MKRLFTIAALLIATTAAGQTPPPLIPFAGVALDDLGQPRSGPLGLTFRIYEGESGSDALWAETQQVTPDAQGRYTVLLGVLSGGVPLDIFQSGRARWLAVQPDGQDEQIRLLLASSVPYALQSADANTLGGLPPSAFVLSGSTGWTSGGSGSVSRAGAGSGALAGDGPVTQQVIADDLIVTGRTAFGTMMLGGAMHTKSPAAGSSGLANAVANSGAFIEGSSASSWGLAIGMDSANEYPFLQGVDFGQTTSRALLLNPFGGMVGLGITLPRSRFHIKNGMVGSTGIANTVVNAGAFVEGSSGSTWGVALGSETTNDFPALQGVNREQTSNRTLLFNPYGGGVGIGTVNPNMNVALHVRGLGGLHLESSLNGAYIKFQNAINAGGFLDYNGTSFNIYANSAQVPTLTVTEGAPGRVGIGTSSPAAMLHVAGSIQVDGNIAAKYQDVAEWVESTEPLVAGEVVVIDATKRNQVRAAQKAYDTRVAGAISPQPGIVLGEPGAGKVLVAQSGRVRIKADATFGAIHAGDLLVTSPTPGHAMRSEAVTVGGVEMHRPGTVIGKALEPLEDGQGEILVLLTLQ